MKLLITLKNGLVKTVELEQTEENIRDLNQLLSSFYDKAALTGSTEITRMIIEDKYKMKRVFFQIVAFEPVLEEV